jgi:glutamate/tyrosine decarboxylase-like PLP-dependent enzyme
MSSDPLALPPDEMRRLGYAAVDALVDATTDWSMPPIRRATPATMRASLAGPAPERGVGAQEALDGLFRDVLPHLARLDHPRYFAFIPCSGTWPGAIGDFVASALSLYAATWMEGAGPTQLELTVLDWFKEWIGFPPDADGQLTSGGSTANLQALACARELRAGPMRGDLILYVSDQAHSSVARAARVLGFTADQVRVLPTDRDLRLRPETLAVAVETDRRRGLTPLLASVSAGATNTGAVDPLLDLAETCREHDVWLHVDGAYGGFAALTDRGRRLLGGIELADSVTLDPHKLLFQPYECGGLLVREPDGLRAAFEIVPPYLRDTRGADDGEVNLGDHGIQQSRTSHAFKVWLSIQTFGLEGFRRAIDRSLDLAEHAARRIEVSDELELVAPQSLGITCFRRRPAGVDDEAELAALNAGLVAELERSGVAFVSSTTLRGRYAIRLCPMNHVTTVDDVDRALDFLERSAAPRASVAPSSVRDVDLARSWLRRQTGVPKEGVDASRVRSIPALADLDEDDASRVAAIATVVHVPAGAVVVREWDVTRDFFVLLSGVVTVAQGGTVVSELRDGEFFGELAARDWGRGYGSPRNATVTAATELELLVLPEGALETVMRLSPKLSAAVEASAAARLP